MPVRFHLPVAILMILGSAIALCYLAYKGSQGGIVIQFDEVIPPHHRKSTWNATAKFCTYLDRNKIIQEHIGSCKDLGLINRPEAINHTIFSDNCMRNNINESLEIISCVKSPDIEIGQRREARKHIRYDWCTIVFPNGTIELKHCPGYGDVVAQNDNLPFLQTPCFTFQPGGRLESCPRNKNRKQYRDNLAKYPEWCLFLEPDGNSVVVYNTTCTITHDKEEPPTTCSECESISPDGHVEAFQCYIKDGLEKLEAVRCSENLKHPRGEIPTFPEPPAEMGCSVIHPNGTVDVVGCADIESNISSSENTGTKPDADGQTSSDDLPHEYEPSSPPIARRQPQDIAASFGLFPNRLHNNTRLSRCAAKFCLWARDQREIEGRCYDGNDKTPCTSDKVLKYTAPYECRLCLNRCKLEPDEQAITKHCQSVTSKEDLAFRVIMGVGAAIILLSVLLCIRAEMKQRQKEDIQKRNTTRAQNERVPVLPPFDGTADISLTDFSISTSQNDAPEIHITSPPRSVTSGLQSTTVFRSPLEPSARSRGSQSNASPSPSPPLVSQGERQVEDNVAVSGHHTDRVSSGSDSAHERSLPSTRAPSERQLVMQPVLPRSSGHCMISGEEQ